MKKSTTLMMLFLLLMSVQETAVAAEWIDITSTYVVNPSFDNNDRTTGWSGTAYGAANPWENAEHYQKVYDTYQFITGLKAGTYRVSVDAFYRMGEASNDYQLYTSGDYASYQHAQLYAMTTEGDFFTPIAPASSAALQNGLGGNTSRVGSRGDYRYLPNNMEAAYYWFEAGYYDNTVEFTVGEDGEARIGLRKSQTISGDWTCLDNWKLEYYGDMVSIEKITLNTSSATLVSGEELQIVANIAPANALLRKLIWTSSNPNVATVDDNGLVKAIALGTASITASATDGSGKSARCTIKVEGNGDRLKQLMITEIQSANLDQTVDPSWNYGGWVELYNGSQQSVSLTGCWLSDDATNLKKVRISEPTAIAAGKYRNLWFDHHDKYCPSQINMKLDVEGGTLLLSDEEGNLLLTMSYPPAVSRCSWARESLTGDVWGWTSRPTPEAANTGVTFTETRLAAPVVDQPTKIFGSSLTVCVNIPEGTTLRYTTDGSTPTATNGATSTDGLFYPTTTTTYRFCLIADGYLPSAVVTRTYILNDKKFALPVFSVVGSNDNLYGEDMGILVRGNGNGRPGNGQSTPCNWNMDWERPVNFEYLNQEGEMVLNQETAMERCGGWSRAWNPCSFKIKANKRYELQNYLPYQVFSDKPYLKHKTLQMRNGGNDTSCRIKDPALQEIIRRSGLNIDYQSYQPAMHYINGRYAGVINVREPNNKHFVYANYGLDEEEIDQFEMSPDSGYIQKCGTYESMQRWYDLAQECGNSEDAYEQICQMVDIDEYCNYMAVQFYLGNWDWPQNNVKAFKPIMEGGKFRFVLFDLDGSLNNTGSFEEFARKQYYDFDPLYDSEVYRYHKEIEVVTIFLGMIKNDNFRKRFIDAYCLVTGSVFEPNRCKDIINELANRVSDSQQIRDDVYWMSTTPWSTANQLINSLSASRQTEMISVLKSYSPMQLSSLTAQQVSLSTNLSEARLLVNDQPVPTNKFSGKLFSPITLKAQAPAGYKFQGWKLIEGEGSNVSTLISTEDTWQYYDQGSLDGENWTATNYDASGWQSGQAPLGYFVGGDRYTNTYLDYGNSTSSKRPTYYFRHNLTLSEAPSESDVFTLNYIIDDGLVIYVNGTEAGRYNMPSGDITYNSYATTYANDNPDSGTLTLPTSLFKRGTNVVAVEIHNNAANSTDIYWEGSITCSSTKEQGQFVCEEEEYEMPSSGNMTLQACYTAMTDEEKRQEGLSTTPIVINEVSAGNSIYVNEYFKKDDWVELYNTTDGDIDLEGMYLTDRSEKPTKYQITAKGTKASTIIPAHGYKVIWCSKRDTDTELHANFKLDNKEGTVIRIMAKDKSWADSIVYCQHNGDQTVGRYPDGSNNIFVMNRPTIARSNEYTSYATAWNYVAPEPIDGIERNMASRSGGMSILYRNGELLVKSEDCPNISLSIYSPSGATVMTQRLLQSEGYARISLSPLPAGVYLAYAKDSEGNECATKFVKK